MVAPIITHEAIQAKSNLCTNRCFSWTKLLLSASLPLVLGIFTIIYTIQQNDIAKRNREQDLIIADANRQQDNKQADELRIQTIYDTYIKDISAQLLSKDFDKSNEKVFIHIRAKTLDILRQLDIERKRNIILFLYEIGLVQRNHQPAVNLGQADLRDVKFIDSSIFSCAFNSLALINVLADNMTFDTCNLDEAVFDGSTMNDAQFLNSKMVGASFVGAHLMRASFLKSNFLRANFTNADLRYSNFGDARFHIVDLTNADLLGSNIPYVHLNAKGNPNILLNTRLSNGSFSKIDTSNLVKNNGAEFGVSSLNRVAEVSSGGEVD